MLGFGCRRGLHPEVTALDLRFVARNRDVVPRPSCACSPVVMPRVPGADEVVSAEPPLSQRPAGVKAGAREGGEGAVLADECDGLTADVNGLDFLALERVCGPKILPVAHGARIVPR